MNKIKTAFLASLLVMSNHTMAESPPASAVGSNLPENVRELLKQEMNAILGASKQILEALIQGEDDVVAMKAKAIHDSFILKQAMTEADRQALMRVVSDAFVEKDRAFHAMAGELSQAAGEGRREQQLILFRQMTKACIECHAAHATDRFPQLQTKGLGDN